MLVRRSLLRYVMLGSLIAALGFLNWKLTGMPVDISPLQGGASTNDAPNSAAGDLPSDSARRPLSELSETVSRPLFHPTRRPVVDRPSEPSEPEAIAAATRELAAVQSSRLSLVGVMKSGGKGRALLRPEGQTYGTWVEVGGEIDGWRLSAITDSRVLIEKSGGQEELLLHAPAAGR